MPTPISGPYIARSVSVSGQTGLLTFLGLTSTNRAKTVRDAADTLLELGGSYTPTGTFTSLTMVTPVLGTPTSGVLTNCTGTADGLTAGDVTRNHAVYAAASPPTVDVGMFTIVKTGIDFKTNAVTDIFTVPSGRTALCNYAYMIPTTVSGGAAVAVVWAIRESGANQAMTTNTAMSSQAPLTNIAHPQSGLTGAGNSANPQICTAGNKVQFNLTTAWTTSTTVTGSVFAVITYIT